MRACRPVRSHAATACLKQETGLATSGLHSRPQAATSFVSFARLRRWTTGTPRSVMLRSLGFAVFRACAWASTFCAHRFSNLSTMWRGKFDPSMIWFLRPGRHDARANAIDKWERGLTIGQPLRWRSQFTLEPARAGDLQQSSTHEPQHTGQYRPLLVKVSEGKLGHSRIQTRTNASAIASMRDCRQLPKSIIPRKVCRLS